MFQRKTRLELTKLSRIPQLISKSFQVSAIFIHADSDARPRPSDWFCKRKVIWPLLILYQHSLIRGTAVKKDKREKGRKWTKKSIIGLILLLISFLMGALLKNSAQITSGTHPRGFSGYCDTYITWLCVPTYYLAVPLATSLWLVVNTTSFLVSLILFIAGVILVRQ